MTDKTDPRFKILLDAGALLDPGTPLAPNEPVDKVEALRFPHPSLDDRVVIRLSSSSLVKADEIEMSVLGFQAPTSSGPLALRRRRAVGFPGDAILRDPERALYALEVVKDLKKAARRARSKPGHAKEDFDAIGETLGRSVPHFLPSYWEEVGRAFLEVGARTFAASAFGKAREAEKVHALTVDEDIRREAFLEFALAGALTNKVLSEYAKDLEKAWKPEVAHAHFRELALRRTLGGMPPWTGMAKDLRRMAKAAKVNTDDEMAFLEELLEAPSLKNAASEFWNSYRESLMAICHRSPGARARLMDLMPTPSKAEGFGLQWLTFLEEAGCIESVVRPRPALPAGDEPSEGAAGWLPRLVGFLGGQRYSHEALPEAFYSLVRRMAPRLKEDAVPIRLDGEQGWWTPAIDVDLLDLLLELGVHVADPGESASLDLTDWAERDPAFEGFPRDPLYVNADSRFQPLIVRAVAAAAGEDKYEEVARGKAGLLEARRAWLGVLADEMVKGALPMLQANLGTFGEKTAESVFEEFPELQSPFEALDPARHLLRTLQVGILDEYGWPALESAWDELNPDGEAEITVSGSFPWLILSTGARLRVVGHRRVEASLDIALPKKASITGARYVDGQVLVATQLHYEGTAFWSETPSRTFEVNYWRLGRIDEPMPPLPDGGSVTGHRVLRAGDTEIPEIEKVWSDGSHWWREETVGDEQKWMEFDPVTGQKGRVSLPRFFEDFIADDYNLCRSDCVLLPAPSDLDASPLGVKDGLIGLRARTWNNEQERAASRPCCVVEGIDGRRYAGDGLDGRVPDSLILLPGNETPRPILKDWNSVHIWSPDGSYCGIDIEADDPDSSRGQVCQIPLIFWNFLQPRDSAVSTQLRNLDEEQDLERIRDLLQVAFDELGPISSEDDDDDDDGEKAEFSFPVTEARIKEAFGVIHPRLLRGLTGVVVKAARLKQNLIATLAARLGKTAPGEAAVANLRDDAARAALAPLFVQTWGWGDKDLGRTLMAWSAFLSGQDCSAYLAKSRKSAGKYCFPPVDSQPWPLVGHIGAVAWLATAPGVAAEHRETLLAFLRIWSETIFSSSEHVFRTSKVAWKSENASHPFRGEQEDGLFGYERDGHHLLARLDTDEDSGSATVLETSDKATFHSFAGLTVTDRSETRERRSAAWIQSFLTEMKARGPIPFNLADAEALAAATGASRAEACLVLVGFPGLQEYGNNFLDKELRTTLGLKVAEAGVARDALKRTSAMDRVRLLDAAMPDDPVDLWGESRVSRLAAAWVQVLGARIPIPEEVVLAVSKELSLDMEGAVALTMMASPATEPRLQKDGHCEMDHGGNLVRVPEETSFDGSTLLSIGCLIPWLFDRLAVGDPLRGAIPVVGRLLLDRLANPDLLLSLGSIYLGDIDEKKREKQVAALLDAVGGATFHPPVPDPDDDEEPERPQGRDNGLVVAVASRWNMELAFRPSRILDDTMDTMLSRLSKLNGDEDVDHLSHTIVTFVRSPGFKAILDRVESTPVPDLGWESNPLLSAPALIEKVRGRLSISEDAAVLYMQTLALRNPTTKDVALWNGWTPARYKKAIAELLDKKLILEAKRARAGRSHFLPGAWEDLKAPNLPVEAWKLPLYGVKRLKGGELDMPLGVILPPRPIHEIFEAAWARIEAGDLPAYEEV